MLKGALETFGLPIHPRRKSSRIGDECREPFFMLYTQRLGSSSPRSFGRAFHHVEELGAALQSWWWRGKFEVLALVQGSSCIRSGLSKDCFDHSGKSGKGSRVGSCVLNPQVK